MDSGRKKKILVADDEKCIRDTLCHALMLKGFIVESACDGKEALDKILEDKPDIIIMDGMMPQVDGIEACKRLRTKMETQEIPIILLSAQKDIVRNVQNLAGAPIKYIQKPCKLEYLLACINDILS